MFLPGMLLGPFPPSNIIKGVSSLTRIADVHVPNPSENAPKKSESRKSYPNRVESRTNRDRIAPTKLTRVATKLPPSAFVPSVFDSSPSLESKIPSLRAPPSAPGVKVPVGRPRLYEKVWTIIPLFRGDRILDRSSFFVGPRRGKKKEAHTPLLFKESPPLSIQTPTGLKGVGGTT